MRSSDRQIRDTGGPSPAIEPCSARSIFSAMTRIRNEALILPDTLDYLGNQVDAIIAYDDASTDETVEICARIPRSR